MHRPWSCAILLLLAGCAPAPTPEQTPAPLDPAAEFRALEERLLSAGALRFDFHVTAEGVIAADLRGGLEITPGERIRLSASGDFGGQAVELSFRSDAGEMEFGNAADPKTAPAPAHLKEALLIGLTRMGILHNLARLTGARPPDHAEGGVREWVQVGAHARDAAGPAGMSFDITVAGERAGAAVLEVDSDGRPVRRRQSVQFPSGEMRVVEEYSALTIGQ
jgi:hypothetical protein